MSQLKEAKFNLYSEQTCSSFLFKQNNCRGILFRSVRRNTDLVFVTIVLNRLSKVLQHETENNSQVEKFNSRTTHFSEAIFRVPLHSGSRTLLKKRRGLLKK